MTITGGFWRDSSLARCSSASILAGIQDLFGNLIKFNLNLHLTYSRRWTQSLQRRTTQLSSPSPLRWLDSCWAPKRDRRELFLWNYLGELSLRLSLGLSWGEEIEVKSFSGIIFWASPSSGAFRRWSIAQDTKMSLWGIVEKAWMSWIGGFKDSCSSGSQIVGVAVTHFLSSNLPHNWAVGRGGQNNFGNAPIRVKTSLEIVQIGKCFISVS